MQLESVVPFAHDRSRSEDQLVFQFIDMSASFHIPRKLSRLVA